MTVKYSDNQGVEGTQSFLARKADVGSGANLSLFTRGTRWEQLFHEVPILYRNLTLKTFDPEDHSPGVVSIKTTFTGYQYSASGGSSGGEVSVGTAEFTGHIEETSILLSKKARALSDEERYSLAKVERGEVEYLSSDAAGERPGGAGLGDGLYYIGEEGARLGASQQIYSSSGDAFTLLKFLMLGQTTYKRSGGTWNYRTESKSGLKDSELNAIGHIVANPPGSPPKPAAGWTYFLGGANQAQSGADRFVKELTFELIEDNDANQFFYTD